MCGVCAAYHPGVAVERRRLTTVNLSPAGHGPMGGGLRNQLRRWLGNTLSQGVTYGPGLFRYEPLARLRQHFFAGRVPYL